MSIRRLLECEIQSIRCFISFDVQSTATFGRKILCRYGVCSNAKYSRYDVLLVLTFNRLRHLVERYYVDTAFARMRNTVDTMFY